MDPESLWAAQAAAGGAGSCRSCSEGSRGPRGVITAVAAAPAPPAGEEPAGHRWAGKEPGLVTAWCPELPGALSPLSFPPQGQNAELSHFRLPQFKVFS